MSSGRKSLSRSPSSRDTIFKDMVDVQVPDLTGRDLTADETRRNEVTNDLLESEKVYLEEMRILTEEIMLPAKKILSLKQIEQIFTNIEELISTNLVKDILAFMV
jgi:hypothetical protein